MNPVIERAVETLRQLSLIRKIILGVLALVMVAGFTTMFLWANKTKFSIAYKSLSKPDAAEIVFKLKESNTAYRLEGGGTTILVPEKEVYDVRLTMAKDGIPKGGGVGYEIFDKTEFGTTEFVQKINKKRAIQGELARTISAFDVVKSARVMIVLPKESVFVEESKKPSASILLELTGELEEENIAAIAHLVASSVQDLTPKLVTIVDTAGRILFEGKSEEEKAKIEAKNLADAQYKYKLRYEQNMADRIETMLERIVGKDKAIVRVTAEMDFSKDNMSEEIYDPYERGAEFIRSRKSRSENVKNDIGEVEIPSSVNPIVPPDQQTIQGGANEIVNKNSDTLNFEISKRIREQIKPMVVVKRVSVAAVVDGRYEYKADEKGKTNRTYMQRPLNEMRQFEDIVIKAMGFNENREDQVTVECFPFTSIAAMEKPEEAFTGWRKVQKEHGRAIANMLLVLLLFLFVIRPVLKTVRGIKTSVDQEELDRLDEMALLEDEKEPAFIELSGTQQKNFLEVMKPDERKKYIVNMSANEKASYLANMVTMDKAKYYAELDFDKSVNIFKGWLSEIEEEEE
ncbi:MAG: flagellar M-ring protein FliF [Desulfobacteraceae bacterium]|nr:flagellar M-ring protein FliF [Desulfobacteraceae bacterium]